MTAYFPIIVMGFIALSLIRGWAGDSRRTLAPVRTLLGHGGVFALTALLMEDRFTSHDGDKLEYEIKDINSKLDRHKDKKSH